MTNVASETGADNIHYNLWADDLFIANVASEATTNLQPSISRKDQQIPDKDYLWKKEITFFVILDIIVILLSNKNILVYFPFNISSSKNVFSNTST